MAAKSLVIPTICVVAMLSLVYPEAGFTRVDVGVSNSGTTQLSDVGLVKATGAKYAHRKLRWDAVAPPVEPRDWRPRDHEDPHYDWDEVDNWLVKARASGLVPVLQLRGAPAWATTCTTPVTVQLDPPCGISKRGFRVFAHAAASRYSQGTGLPRVHYWQVLNEPNLKYFFYPQRGGSGNVVAPRAYSELYAGAYHAIKRANRRSKVILAGLAPIGRPGTTISPLNFLRRMLCMRSSGSKIGGSCKPLLADIVAIHPYSTGGPHTQSQAKTDIQLGDLPRFVSFIRRAERAGLIRSQSRLKVWVTEFSWDSKPPDPGGVPMRVLERWVSEALRVANRAGVSAFFWHSIRDQLPNGRSHPNTVESGIAYHPSVSYSHGLKPFIRSLRAPLAGSLRRGSVNLWGQLPVARAERVRLDRWAQGRWIAVGRSKTTRFGTYTFNLRGERARSCCYRVRGRSVTSATAFPRHRLPSWYQPPFGRRGV